MLVCVLQAAKHSIVVVVCCVYCERSCYCVDRRCVFVLEAVETKRVGGR